MVIRFIVFLNSVNLICRCTDISKYLRESLSFEIARVECSFRFIAKEEKMLFISHLQNSLRLLASHVGCSLITWDVADHVGCSKRENLREMSNPIFCQKIRTHHQLIARPTVKLSKRRTYEVCPVITLVRP